MNIEGFIELANKPQALRFLVIGGYAVGVHGHPRATYDVDFLAPAEDRNVWAERLGNAGLKKIAETNTFAQFSQEAGEGFDVMFVHSETFEKMWTASQPISFGQSNARVPALDHLLALKLHALKQNLRHRTSKDADDVEVLIRRNKLDILNPKYEDLFLKYGNREIYETFLRILRH